MIQPAQKKKTNRALISVDIADKDLFCGMMPTVKIMETVEKHSVQSVCLWETNREEEKNREKTKSESLPRSCL